MSEFRMKRINEQVRRELSQLIRTHLPVEKYGLISVTSVEVSKDLKNAHVYISTVGVGPANGTALTALEKVRRDLQKELSRRVVMKYTPHLFFKEDSGLERGHHIVEILDSLDDPLDKGQKS
jgi:ribosome-binding factor A